MSPRASQSRATLARHPSRWRRLDGLPLALELAAASMRLLTPDQILARLSQQLERPGALADLPGRQQTLTATIQRSYDVQPAPARQNSPPSNKLRRC